MEHETTSVISLMLVTGIAFFIPILLQRFRLKAIPVVVAEILAGILIGKSGFNIIDVEDAWLTLLSMLGLIYLMFLSGVEIDFSSFKKKKTVVKKRRNPFIIASLIVLVMIGLSFLFSLMLTAIKLIDDPYFMTIILATVSLGVVVPVLKEKKILETELGQTVLLIAVISDFITMILFAYYLAFKAGDTKIVIWILLLLGLVVMLFVILNWFRKKQVTKVSEALRKGTVQIGTRGVFALILFFVAISETLGIESILGAFLAGVIVSLLAPNKEFIHQLDSFGYGFLIPIFFVMVGVKLDVSVLFENKNILVMIPIVLILLYCARMIPVLLIKKIYGWKNAIASGILLTSTMSLAIVAASVAVEMNLISSALNSAIVLVSIFTCFISPIFYNKLASQPLQKQKTLNIVGANRVALQTSLVLMKEGSDVKVFTKASEKIEMESEYPHSFPIVELIDLSIEVLLKNKVFECDELIIATGEDVLNITIAEYAKELGVEKIIVKIEHPRLNKQYVNKGYSVYSDVFAGRTLLMALISSPNLVRFISQTDENLREIEIKKEKYNGLKLRQLPFLGDVLIFSIYRGQESIMPHGDTILKKGDRLLVSGNIDAIRKLKDEV